MLVSPSGRDPLTNLKPVCTAGDMRAIIQTAAHIHVSQAVAAYAVQLLTATRQSPQIRLGASPRAGLALLAMSRVRALMKGQDAVFPGDVRAMAVPVLSHRLVLADGDMGVSAEDRAHLLESLLNTVPAPRGA